jgi:iron complex outermembrane receptor protein
VAAIAATTCVFLQAPLIAVQVPQGRLRVEVRASAAPVDNAEVIVSGVTHRTDPGGVVTIAAATGAVEVTVVKEGFVPVTTTVRVEADREHPVIVDLQEQPAIEEHVTVVGATRTDRRIEDQPMRVEVLEREEIEEKMLMTPGDIVMMLNEMGGMRVQATSPSLGAASVRIQGMRGRYTRVLSDGLPLFGDVGGLGLLQIPPMDLGQVEVIKGVASALYGTGAMGGLVNLRARRPGSGPEREFLLNQSTRGATDAVMHLASPLAKGWSASLLGGGHWQRIADVEGDGWADLPGYQRGVVRPRVFWEGSGGGSLLATAGLTSEDRTGGTIEGQTLPATAQPYTEALNTHRYDAGAVGQFPVGGYVLTTRAAMSYQRHDHRFGENRERDRHQTAFGEVAVRGTRARSVWIAGAAFQRDQYTPVDIPRFAYTHTVPGVFGQYDVEMSPMWSISASGRLDAHSEYGTFFSPRVSALLRKGQWSSRVSVGTGFVGSTPLTEETEAAGLTRLTVDLPLEAERGLSVSADLSRTDGPLSYTATLFASRIEDPLYVHRSDVYALVNLTDPTTNVGVEVLATLRREPYALTGTYSYVHARETVDGAARDVTLTPRHSAGLGGMWEV